MFNLVSRKSVSSLRRRDNTFTLLCYLDHGTLLGGVYQGILRLRLWNSSTVTGGGKALSKSVGEVEEEGSGSREILFLSHTRTLRPPPLRLNSPKDGDTLMVKTQEIDSRDRRD